MTILPAPSVTPSVSDDLLTDQQLCDELAITIHNIGILERQVEALREHRNDLLRAGRARGWKPNDLGALADLDPSRISQIAPASTDSVAA